MLEDRDYMRQPEFDERRWHPQFQWGWSWTMILLAINLVVFVLVEISKAYKPEIFSIIYRYFALGSDGLGHGYVWQLLTFQFLHFAPWHFIGNMVGLFFLGRALEYLIGGRRFIAVYLVSGLIGGAFQAALGLIFPEVFGVPVVGASAGVFGLLAALATLEPNAEFLMFFVFPVKIKYLALVGAVVAIFYIIVPAEPGIAHAAHLGGMAAGTFYIWRFLKNPAPPGAEEQADVQPSKKAGSKSIADADEDLEGDVDTILDKISARGIQSLTTREREILERARARMVKR